jgi:hypothetical protein
MHLSSLVPLTFSPPVAFSHFPGCFILLPPNSSSNRAQRGYSCSVSSTCHSSNWRWSFSSSASIPFFMDKERFDRALAYLVEKSAARLTPYQQRFIQTVHDGFAEVRTCPNIGTTTIQTLVAAVVAVSQSTGDVVYFGLNGRKARQWIEQVNTWLDVFKDHPEFGFVVTRQDAREYTVIRNVTGNEKRISAFPLSWNIRGMDAKLILADIQENQRQTLLPLILPLMANGSSCVVSRIILPVDTVHVTVDLFKEATIVSTIERDGAIEYVGADQYTFHNIDDMITFLYEHIQRVRDNVLECERSIFHVFVESNINWGLAQRIPDKSKRITFWGERPTTKVTKALLAEKLRTGTFRMHPNFVSLEPKTSARIEEALSGTENEFYMVCGLNATVKEE